VNVYCDRVRGSSTHGLSNRFLPFLPLKQLQYLQTPSHASGQWYRRLPINLDQILDLADRSMRSPLNQRLGKRGKRVAPKPLPSAREGVKKYYEYMKSPCVRCNLRASKLTKASQNTDKALKQENRLPPRLHFVQHVARKTGGSDSLGPSRTDS